MTAQNLRTLQILSLLQVLCGKSKIRRASELKYLDACLSRMKWTHCFFISMIKFENKTFLWCLNGIYSKETFFEKKGFGTMYIVLWKGIQEVLVVNRIITSDILGLFYVVYPKSLHISESHQLKQNIWTTNQDYRRPVPTNNKDDITWTETVEIIYSYKETLKKSLKERKNLEFLQELFMSNFYQHDRKKILTFCYL